MEKAIQERIHAKTRDSQLYEIFVNQFEFSSKAAEAAINISEKGLRTKPFSPGPVVQDRPNYPAGCLDQGKIRSPAPGITQSDRYPHRGHRPRRSEVFRQHDVQGLREVQICRLTEKAFEQGGVLTQEDLAEILQVDTRTIRRTIKQLQERGVKVQTRGIYHDIGPSVSHKAWIVGLYLNYKPYSEIVRTTRHSLTSIKRYIMDFGQVVLCTKKA